MHQKNSLVFAIFFTAIVAVIGLGIGASAYLSLRPQAIQPQTFSSADINAFNEFSTGTSVWVGKDVETQIVATNTARTYLAISNISGATGTAQTLYCNINDRPAALYSGFVIHASTTPLEFTLDAMYRGALRCKFPVASGTVTIIER